jgi:hypothetical protein
MSERGNSGGFAATISPLAAGSRHSERSEESLLNYKYRRIASGKALAMTKAGRHTVTRHTSPITGSRHSERSEESLFNYKNRWIASGKALAMTKAGYHTCLPSRY